MENLFKKLKVGIIIAFTIGLLGGFGGGFFYAVHLDEAAQDRAQGIEYLKDPNQTATDTLVNTEEYLSYRGQNGEDALTLLKKQASIEKNTSSLVVGINGRKADDTKREYWAFYVNGKMAQVGPAEYQTKTGDKIEWKIEKY